MGSKALKGFRVSTHLQLVYFVKRIEYEKEPHEFGRAYRYFEALNLDDDFICNAETAYHYGTVKDWMVYGASTDATEGIKV